VVKKEKPEKEMSEMNIAEIIDYKSKEDRMKRRVK
jgi:hypothetical protein